MEILFNVMRVVKSTLNAKPAIQVHAFLVYRAGDYQVDHAMIARLSFLFAQPVQTQPA